MGKNVFYIYEIKFMKIFSIIVFPFLFISCLKKEIPVPIPEPGNIKTVTIKIDYPYKYQVYYDCETNSVVSTNTKYDWDIAFECAADSNHITLNTAKGVFIANQGTVDFSSVTSIAGGQWLWDNFAGDLTLTAIGDWRNKHEVYILDRQYNEQGLHLGYVKIMFQEVTTTSYTFKYANLDGTNEHVITINKDNKLNFIAFSFDSNTSIALEPASEKWDLLFTNHQHFFSNLSFPFVLTQVLGNTYNGVITAEDNNGDFLNLDLLSVSKYTFTNIKDEIGYDWKIRNSADNSFTIDGKKSFIIRTVEGFYYKIRFIDFYNSGGVKGYPKFEIQRL